MLVRLRPSWHGSFRRVVRGLNPADLDKSGQPRRTEKLTTGDPPVERALVFAPGQVQTLTDSDEIASIAGDLYTLAHPAGALEELIEEALAPAAARPAPAPEPPAAKKTKTATRPPRGE